MTEQVKRPSFQFYPGDWLSDRALRACSLEARGLWMDMLALMHQCQPYGYLILNGKPIDDATLARMVGESPTRVRKALAELEGVGVYSRDHAGSIFSRRMIKDEYIRVLRAKSGRLGGNPNLVNQQDKHDDNQPDKQTPKQSPTPSSSSSSSSSSSTSVDQKRARKRATPPERPTDVCEQVWNDWLELRNRKRAPVTATVLAAARLEAGKAQMPLEKFLATWCVRGSQGLQAEWLSNGNGAGHGSKEVGRKPSIAERAEESVRLADEFYGRPS